MKKNKYLQVLACIVLLAYVITGCTKAEQHILYEDEYLLYNIDSMSFKGNSDLNKTTWIDAENKEEKLENINLYIDGTASIFEYKKYNESEKYLDLISNIEPITNKLFNNYEFTPYVVVDDCIFELSKHNRPPTNTIEEQYRYIPNSFNIEFTMNYLNFSFSGQIEGVKWRHLDVISLINECYLKNETTSNTLNILASPLNGLRDNDFMEFYRNITNLMNQYDFTYGFIQLDENNPFYLIIFGNEKLVTDFILNFESQAVDRYDIDAGKIKYIVPDVSKTVKLESIPIHINSAIDLTNNKFSLFVKQSEAPEYFPNKEYSNIEKSTKNEIIALEAFPNENIQNEEIVIEGELIANFPIYHSKDSWINMENWECDYDCITIRGEKKLNLTDVNSVYQAKLEEINEIDISQDMYDYMINAFMTRSDVQINNKNNNDWEKLIKEYREEKQNYFMRSEKEVVEITSIKNNEANSQFLVNFELDTSKLYSDIPYLIYINLKIIPDYCIKKMPEWVEGSELLYNITTPLIDRACMPESDIISRDFILVVNKSLEDWDADEIRRIQNEGYVVLSKAESKTFIEDEEPIFADSENENETVDENSLLGKIAKLLTPKTN